MRRRIDYLTTEGVEKGACKLTDKGWEKDACKQVARATNLFSNTSYLLNIVLVLSEGDKSVPE